MKLRTELWMIFTFVALSVTVLLAEHPAYKIPYYLPEGSTLANNTPEQLKDKELAFLKEKAAKRGYELTPIKGEKMLYLNFKRGQTINFGNGISIKFDDQCQWGKMRIGIEAPKDVKISRGKAVKASAEKFNPVAPRKLVNQNAKSST